MSPLSAALPIPRLLMHWFEADRVSFTYPVETYDQWFILGCQAGVFEYRLEGGEAGLCSAGQFVLCPPGIPLHRRIPERATFYGLRFSWSAKEVAAGQGKRAVRDLARLESTLNLISGSRARWPGGISDPWMNHLLADLLYQAVCDRPSVDAAPIDPALVRAARELREPGRHGGRTLTEIAKSVRLSPSQFSRHFRAAYQISPAAYRTRHRLQHARELLLGGNQTLEQIAEACGFENAFYFSRVFSREAGQAPSVFRRQNRV